MPNPRSSSQLLLILLSLTMVLFYSNVKGQKSTTPTYIESINEWHKLREVELKSPKGWLNLEGLFWLHKGVNSFGAGKNNDCVYENPNPFDVFFPDHSGNFIFEGDSVIWESPDKYMVMVNNQSMPLKSKVCVFNQAFNPPCAFTKFATCPLPPPQNRLPFAITAGEKNYGHH